MKTDLVRIRKYLAEIQKNSHELNEIIDQNRLSPGSIELKAAKYMLIELAEAMANTLQHILAKDRGVAVSGYIDTILKAHEYGIVSEDLFAALKPFFDFRNSLIHRYWKVDDAVLISNIQTGKNDFEKFIEEIEAYLSRQPGNT